MGVVFPWESRMCQLISLNLPQFRGKRVRIYNKNPPSPPLPAAALRPLAQRYLCQYHSSHVESSPSVSASAAHPKMFLASELQPQSSLARAVRGRVVTREGVWLCWTLGMRV